MSNDKSNSSSIDLTGLPKELIVQLSPAATGMKPNHRGANKANNRYVKAVFALGGVATTDEIIVQIYRTSGKIVRRTNASSSLARLSSDGRLTKIGMGKYSVAVPA